VADVQLFQAVSALPNRVSLKLQSATYTGGALFLAGRGESLAVPASTFGSVFNEYRVNKMCYEFVTRSATIQPVALTWAFIEDPAWYQSHNTVQQDSSVYREYYPTELQVSTVANAWQFPIWQTTVCMDVTKFLPKEWKFVNGSQPLGPDRTASEAKGGQSAVDLRTVYSGSICMACDDTNGLDGVSVGSLFISYEIDYHDISYGPTTNVDPSLMEEKECRPPMKPKSTSSKHS